MILCFDFFALHRFAEEKPVFGELESL